MYIEYIGKEKHLFVENGLRGISEHTFANVDSPYSVTFVYLTS